MRRFFTVLGFGLFVAPLAGAAPGLSYKEKLVVVIQKPQVTYVLTKQNLNPRYDLELKVSFLPRVVDSVNQKPF